MPAMADYDANETYANSCTVDVLNVSTGETGIATANFSPNTYTCNSGTYLAADGIECITCPAGSFCPGGTYTYNASAADGINSCPSGYTSSDSGVSANTQCYTDCTTARFAHSTGVSGRDYYGEGVDTCVITSCATGYTVDSSATSCIANTITVRWGDKDGNVHATNSCTYDSTLTTPTTAPTAPKGHHFTGWTFQVSSPTFDFSTLNTVTNGTSYTNNASAMTWTVNFDGYDISGVSLCSVTPGDWMALGTPDESTSGGQFCWCKATGYKASGTDTVLGPSSSLDWGFYDGFSSASECLTECADNCGYMVQDSSEFRQLAFGQSSN